MDELLREFLTETNESLDLIDVELVRFEQDPNNAKILDNIFRLVHTIKGTCGFLGLPRLQALAHSVATIDRIKQILADLERREREPDGSDRDLIDMLERMAAPRKAVESATASPQITTGSLVYQVLERPLRPGEVPLDELERAFRETPGPFLAQIRAAPRRFGIPTVRFQ
jgi:two-component system chemotaxis sensor kinase CheA